MMDDSKQTVSFHCNRVGAHMNSEHCNSMLKTWLSLNLTDSHHWEGEVDRMSHPNQKATIECLLNKRKSNFSNEVSPNISTTFQYRTRADEYLENHSLVDICLKQQKNKLQINQRLQCKTWASKTARILYMLNTLRHWYGLWYIC